LEKYGGKGKEGDFFGEKWEDLAIDIASERRLDFQIQPSLLVISNLTRINNPENVED
jgi:hypothetical protein